MIKISFAAAIALTAFVFLPEADAQDRQLKLNTNVKKEETLRVRCKVEDVFVTGNGEGVSCKGQNDRSAILVFNNNSAFFALANEMVEAPTLFRTFVLTKDAGSGACLAIRAVKGNLPCFKVKLARLSAKDSPVKISDANSNWPNIPTADARPD